MREGASVATQVCVVGGGPAGLMLAYLLARAGLQVTVLEKHADFFRDFRGDTMHPSTLEVLHELGLLDALLRLPHQETRRISAQIGSETVPVADFTRLKTRCGFIAFMPQWDFLDFLADEAGRYPGFDLRRSTRATRLVEEGGRVVGVEAEGPRGPEIVKANLVVGCDGRHSTVRESAGLAVDVLGAPIDVLWFRLPRVDSDPGESLGRIDSGQMLALINRGDYWQAGYVIAKGSLDTLKARGLEAFRARLASLMPALADRTGEIRDWDDVKLLTVAVDRLPRWHRPGLLCIGDAAHAMSPVGGIGINLAIQDAVAAANILAGPLLNGSLTEDHLAAVQQRRLWPTRLTQRAQVLIQDRVLSAVLGAAGPMRPPGALRLLRRFPVLQAIPARLIGLGVRPEHVSAGLRGAFSARAAHS